MKKVISAVLIIFSMNLHGQNINVKFIQTYCENDDWDSRERYVSIYKGDSLIIKHPKSRLGEFYLKNLEVGKYKILLTNIFGQEIEEQFQIDSTTNEVKYCIDKFKETNEATLFSHLKENDKLEIIYSSIGCFHLNNERIVFYYKKGELYVDYFENKKKKKSKKLSNSDLTKLIEFEKRLRQMKNNMGGCTTSNNFIFKLNGKEQFEITDESCDWNGYYKVKREIIKIKK